MKSLKYNILVVFTLLMSLGSCSKDNPFYNEDGDTTSNGKVAISTLKVDVKNVQSIITSRASDIDLSSFIVSIINKSDNSVVESWAYSQMPEIVTLPVGSYAAEVKSHILQSAEWEKPYFYGTQDFTIKKDDIVEVGTVNCTIQNVKVTILFSEELTAVMGNDVKVNVVVGDKGSLSYAYNETRAGYFEFVPGSTTLVATFSGTVDGVVENGYKIFVDIAPGQHRIITYTLKDPSNDVPEEFGTMNPSLIIDAKVKTVDLTIDIPGDEETITPDNPGGGGDSGEGEGGGDSGDSDATAPTITSTSLNLEGNNVVVAGMKADVDINSQNGVKTFVVNIISDTLTPDLLQDVGLSDTFDLANPGTLKEGLEGLGFPTGSEVVGKTYLKFDISGFMSLLKIYKGEHRFKLTVTDSKNLVVTKTLTFVVE